MISTEDLVDMRATLDQSMPETCVVYAPTEVSDGRGGSTISWAAGSPVVCRLAPITAGGSSESEQIERLATIEGWMLTLPVVTVVAPAARITVNGTRGFEVTLPLGPRSFEVARRVAVTEML